VATPASSEPKPAAKPEKQATTPAKGSFVVQAGAFSVKQNADRVAQAIGGEVSKSGSLYLVRTGPFVSRKEAEGSLAKVKAAGYSDARIY
jgi:rare lipoprotein A